MQHCCSDAGNGTTRDKEHCAEWVMSLWKLTSLQAILIHRMTCCRVDALEMEDCAKAGISGICKHTGACRSHSCRRCATAV